MSVLYRRDLADEPESWSRLAREIAAFDGAEPFSDQARLDAAAGRRLAFEVRAEGPTVSAPHTVAGALILGAGELDLALVPEYRGMGLGTRAVREALASADAGTPDKGRAPLTAWSHGDHPAARALAARFDFTATRHLLRLRRALTPDGARSRVPAESDRDGVRPEAFRPGKDDVEWVRLNSRIFAAHPEQGSLTADDLRARAAEPWFCAGDFLVARDTAGRMTGYNWLKIEPGARDGEVYVIGVAPEASGQGLGRRLMLAGLARLAQRGCSAATLYVEGDNLPALGLYRSLGFQDDTLDVQYTRLDSAAGR